MEASLSHPSADPTHPEPPTTDAFESPGVLAADRRTADDRVLPSRDDVVVAEASNIVGGPIGTHAVIGRSRAWTPLRVLFLLALCALALSWFGKAACLQQAPADPGNASSTSMRLNWDNQRQFTNLCYSDVIALFGAERLDRGAFPYRTFWFDKTPDGGEQKRYMEYPVITGMYMYGVASVARAWESLSDSWGFLKSLDVVVFFDLAALGLALFWLVTIWATALTARRRVWVAWIAALSPLVIVHAFTNFDALAVAFVALAMLAWARQRPWLAGILIGLGAATKLYPLLLLAVLFILCLRAGRLRAFAEAAGAAVVTWVAVNLPILILYPTGWREFFRYNTDRSADSDTIYRVIADVGGFSWDVGILNIVSFVLLLVVVAGITALGLRAGQRPRVAQLMFLLVAGFLLVNKVWSPQYSLWLVPLAVLAIPHTRLLFTWMIIDALVWIPRMGLFLDDDRRWLPDQWFTFAVLVRAAMVIALCIVVVWQILRPADDLIRQGPDGELLDDPAGGVLDGAPDRVWSRQSDAEQVEVTSGSIMPEAEPPTHHLEDSPNPATGPHN